MNAVELLRRCACVDPFMFIVAIGRCCCCCWSILRADGSPYSSRDRLRGLEGDTGDMGYRPLEGGGRGCQRTSINCHGRDGEGGSYGSRAEVGGVGCMMRWLDVRRADLGVSRCYTRQSSMVYVTTQKTHLFNLVDCHVCPPIACLDRCELETLLKSLHFLYTSAPRQFTRHDTPTVQDSPSPCRSFARTSRLQHHFESPDSLDPKTSPSLPHS